MEKIKNNLTPAAAIIELNRLKDNSLVSDADRRNAAVDTGIRAIRAHFDNREVLYTDDNGVDIFHCPQCWCQVLGEWSSYCSHCGQALDWSEHR